MSEAFRSLFSLVAGYLQGDSLRVQVALANAPPQELAGQSLRHKCAALLFEAAVAQREESNHARELVTLLKPAIASFVVEAAQMREQVNDIVKTLNAAAVPFALLKSAGRLYGGDRLAERTQTFDIDIFIPVSAAADAAKALQSNGYRYENEAQAMGYLRYHHHLAPMYHPQFRKALEVHVALAPFDRFSLPTTWEALSRDMETIDGAAGPARRFNALGRAWHMALHGAPLYRLGDAAQIAIELQSDRTILDRLFERSRGEQISQIPLQAVLCAGASLAGLRIPCERAALFYADWAMRREDLPRYFRSRAQLVDAWYANGGGLRGPATRLAIPGARSGNGETIPLTRRARTLAGLALVAAAVALKR